MAKNKNKSEKEKNTIEGDWKLKGGLSRSPGLAMTSGEEARMMAKKTSNDLKNKADRDDVESLEKKVAELGSELKDINKRLEELKKRFHERQKD